MKRIFYVVLGLHLVFGCIAGPDGSSPSPREEGPDAGAGIDVLEVDTGHFDTGQAGAGLWSWEEVEGTACGNGTQTGMGISEGTNDTRILLFFSGGGACWDGTSCHIVNSAVNIETLYGETAFRSDLRAVQSSGIVDRGEGPFADANFVFVPYCTGDFHAGDAIASYDAFNPNRRVHHKGAVNVEAYLREVKARWPNATEIFAVGVSAGGYGVMLNLDRIERAFPEAKVHVLADSSQMVQPGEGRWGMWKRAWNMELPEDCEPCAERFSHYAAHIVASHPESRIGLLAYEDDAVVAVFFAQPFDGIGAATRALVRDAYESAHSRAFLMPGTEHVMLGGYRSLRNADGESLKDFVGAWASGTGW